MSTDSSAPETVTAKIDLKLGEHRLQTQVEVPLTPVRQRYFLPMVQNLADAIVAAAIAKEEGQGRKVSCKAGCGACCRQLVPISETEAYHIAALVGDLPEPRRTTIRARFAAARRRLDEAGVLERIESYTQASVEENQQLAIDYFKLGIACPFLDDESCTIHPDRPVSCREFLVTSPAERCAHPEAGGLTEVELPVKVWTVLARMDPVPAEARVFRWVALSLAPDWAACHPDESPARPGPEIAQEFFQKLAGEPNQAPSPPTATVVAAGTPAF